MIKTPAEIELLERAATTTRRAVEAAFAAAQPGDTEKKVANNIVYHLFEPTDMSDKRPMARSRDAYHLGTTERRLRRAKPAKASRPALG